jgi:hypothetical protein
MAVIDLRIGGWFSISNKVMDYMLPRIGLPGLGCYCLLSRYADKDKKAHPSLSRFARVLGLSKRTVIRAIQKLVEAKMVVVYRAHGKVSDYALLQFEAGPPVPTQPQLPLVPEGKMGKQGNKTGDTREPVGGAVVSPPRFPGVTTPECTPECMNKTHHQHLGEPVVKVVSAAEAHPTIVFLRSRVRVQVVVDRIAATASPELLDAALRHWRAISDGKAKFDVGLLVRFCEKPLAYGFKQIGDEWKPPSPMATDVREIERQRKAREEQERIHRVQKLNADTEAARQPNDLTGIIGDAFGNWLEEKHGARTMSEASELWMKKHREEERLRLERRPGA